MTSVLIQNVDEAVLARLQARALASGRSVEDLARDILSAAPPLSPAERVAVAEYVRGMGPCVVDTDSWQLVREDRDSR
jgi:plasmid stability protein